MQANREVNWMSEMTLNEFDSQSTRNITDYPTSEEKPQRTCGNEHQQSEKENAET